MNKFKRVKLRDKSTRNQIIRDTIVATKYQTDVSEIFNKLNDVVKRAISVMNTINL